MRMPITRFGLYSDQKQTFFFLKSRNPSVTIHVPRHYLPSSGQMNAQVNG